MSQVRARVTPKASDNDVQSIVKAVRIVEALARGGERGVTELSRELSINKTTIYKFLNTLKNLGYVKQEEQNTKYALTTKFLEIGYETIDSQNEISVIHPMLQKLAEESEHLVQLAVLDEASVVYIDSIDPTHSLKMFSTIGKKAPAYCTATGKSLLAWHTDDELRKILRAVRFRKFTGNTITSMTAFMEELKETRARGYSMDNEELEPGIKCIGGPIFNHSGIVIAAASVSSSTHLLRDSKIERFKRLVVDTCAQISHVLGYPG